MTLLDLLTQGWWVIRYSEAVLGMLIMKHCEFLLLRDLKTEVSTTSALDSHRADFGLLRGLGERVPWETV